MHVKPIRGAAVLVAAILITAIVPSAAEAATGNCAAGYSCIWRDHDYKTAGADSTLVRLYYYIPNLSGYQYRGSDGTGSNSGYSANNSATSVYNHGNSDLCRYYKDAYGAGGYFILEPGSVRNNLATSLSPQGFNDSLSSIYFSAYDPNF